MSHVSHEDPPKPGGRPPHRAKLTLRERVEDFVCRELGADSVTSETRFVEDLHVDSLALVELAIAMEEEFEIPEMDDSHIDKLVFVDDVFKYIERRVKQ